MQPLVGVIMGSVSGWETLQHELHRLELELPIKHSPSHVQGASVLLALLVGLA